MAVGSAGRRGIETLRHRTQTENGSPGARALEGAPGGHTVDVRAERHRQSETQRDGKADVLAALVLKDPKGRRVVIRLICVQRDTERHRESETQRDGKADVLAALVLKGV